MGDLALATDLLEDEFGQFEHGELAGVAEVHGADDLFLLHEADEAVDQVVDEAEGPGLGSLAVHGEVVALEGLDDEVGDDAPVVGEHAGAVGVEDADDADIDAVLAVVVKEEGLGGTLPLVVAGAQPDGVDVAPVGLGLGVDVGVSVDLGGGGLEDAGLHPLGEAEAVDRPDHGGLHGLDGVELVVRRGGRAGQVVDAVDLELEGVDDVVPYELESGIPHEVPDVGLPPGEEVVEADDVVSLPDESVAEMGAEEAGPSGDQYTHGMCLCYRCVGKSGKEQGSVGVVVVSVDLLAPVGAVIFPGIVIGVVGARSGRNEVEDDAGGVHVDFPE